MTPLEFTLFAFLIALAAGLLGALLGLGGGVVIVPGLTLLLGVDIRYAIGASIVGVIATSCGAAAAFVREGVANLRLGMLLETATATGAICGAALAGLVEPRWLYLFFAAVMAYAAISMLFSRKLDRPDSEGMTDPLADQLRLHGVFYDRAIREKVEYRVCRTRLGLGLSLAAGVVSGLLGVGGGFMKVPAMNLGMRIPIKAAAATSNFMIGVTAAASAAVYFMRGDIQPFIAGPVAAGVLLGAMIGARVAGRSRSELIQRLLVMVILIVGVQMLLKGLGR